MTTPDAIMKEISEHGTSLALMYHMGNQVIDYNLEKDKCSPSGLHELMEELAKLDKSAARKFKMELLEISLAYEELELRKKNFARDFSNVVSELLSK